MKVLGLDLGSRHSAAVVLEDGELLKHYEWREEDKGEPLNARLLTFGGWLMSIIQESNIGWENGDVIAVEVPYMGIAQAALALGKQLGVVLAVSWRAEVELIEVATKEAKAALTGKGSAYKQEMIVAAKMQFPGPEWTEHTADALGVALCAIAKLKERALLAQASHRDAPGRAME